MKKLHTLITVIFIVSVFSLATGCGGTEETSQTSETTSETPEDKVLEVVRKNLEMSEKEDLEGTMSTISSDAEIYDQTEQTMKQLFEAYDLKYEINEIEVVEISDNEAKVKVVQTTTKVEGPEFRDNKVELVHTLKLKDGKWGILSSETVNVEFLDDQTTEVATDDIEVSKELVLLELYAQIFTALDEDNGNVPGEKPAQETMDFIKENINLFPVASQKEIDTVMQEVDESIEYKHLNKNIEKYKTSLFKDVGEVVEIEEMSDPELGTITIIHVMNDDWDSYQVVLYGSVEVYEGDYINFIGLPVMYTGFENVSGGYTNIVMALGSYVELVE